jgi:RNA recognition motif-containing protein
MMEPLASAHVRNGMLVPWLCIDGLDRDYTDAELYTLCLPFGKVRMARVTRNMRGASLGYGYVEMATELSAQTAAKTLDLTELLGKTLRISLIPRQRPGIGAPRPHHARRKR